MRTARWILAAVTAAGLLLTGASPALAATPDHHTGITLRGIDLDRHRHRHGARGPLEGIPVLLKDNIDTADRLHTTAGSYALLGARPPRAGTRRTWPG